MAVPTKLLDLNDDCLRHLFTYLPLLDLATMASICVRSHNLARMVCAERAKHHVMSMAVCHVNRSGRSCYTPNKHLLVRVQLCLSYLGEYLTTINIHGAIPRHDQHCHTRWNNVILNGIGLRTSDQLTELRLDTVIVDVAKLPRLASLRCLHLYNCMDIEYRNQRLQSLDFAMSWAIDGQSNRTADFVDHLAAPDQLEELHITLMDIDHEFLRTLATYTRLRVLKLNTMRFRGVATQRCWRKLRHMSQLREISFVAIDTVEDFVRHLGNQASLQIFEIDNCPIHERFAGAFVAFNQMRVLKMGSLVFSHGADFFGLNQFPSVTELHLVDLHALNFSNVTEIIANLPMLTLLTLVQTMFSSVYTPLTADDISDWANIYEVRQKTLLVRITEFFMERFLKVPMEVMDFHRNFIDVTVIEN